jgi:hypothetical protein
MVNVGNDDDVSNIFSAHIFSAQGSGCAWQLALQRTGSGFSTIKMKGFGASEWTAEPIAVNGEPRLAYDRNLKGQVSVAKTHVVASNLPVITTRAYPRDAARLCRCQQTVAMQ